MNSNAQLQLLLVVGAGAGMELPFWRSCGAQQLILVEPQQELVRQLARAIQSDAGVHVEPVALVGEGEMQDSTSNTVQLLQYALIEDSSLFLPAQGMRRLYPNLRDPKPVDVECIPFSDFLSQVFEDLPAESTAALIMDASGAELPLLRSVEPRLLQRFQWLEVTTSEEPLYASGSSVFAVSMVLEEAGFKLESTRVPPLGIGSVLRFELDVRAVRLSSLEQALESALASEAELKSAYALMLESCQQLNEQLAAQTRELAAVHKSTADLEAAHAAAAQQAKQAQDKLQSELQAERKLLSESTSKLDAERKAKANLETTNKELQSTNQDLTTRQALFNEELARAEGQIELIKDLLLREGGGL